MPRVLQKFKEPSKADTQALWIQEAEQRADEMRNGQVRGEPIAEVLARIRTKLS